MVPGAITLGFVGGTLGILSVAGSRHIFLSENRHTAFQEALRIGHAAEHSLVAAPDQKHEPTIDCRFAEVVYLEKLGMARTAVQVCLGEKAAGETMGFDHEFHPEAQVPPPMF